MRISDWSSDVCSSDLYVSKILTEEQAKAAGEPYHLAVDNRMVVPVGKQVKLIITGADVIHSFAVPALWTKMDAVPGRANETTFTVNKPGVYYGQCSELCGVDHGYMPIAVEALPMDKWKAWVRSKGGNPDGAEAAAPAAAQPVPEGPIAAVRTTAPAETPEQAAGDEPRQEERGGVTEGGNSAKFRWSHEELKKNIKQRTNPPTK